MAYKLNMTNRLGFLKGSMFTPSPTEAGDLFRKKKTWTKMTKTMKNCNQ
jgi:hypothetical protein